MKAPRLLAALLVAILSPASSAVAGGAAQEPARSPQEAPPAAGEQAAVERWFGELDAEVVKLRMLLEFTPGDGGRAEKAVLYSLDQGNAPLKIDQCQLSEGKLTFRSSQVQASFSGEAHEDGRTIKGVFTQLGRERPLTLQRVAAPPRVEALEIWEGVIQTGLRELTLRFRVLELPENETTCRFDSVDERVIGLTAERTVTGDQVQWKAPAIRGEFTGQANEDGELVGKWKQGDIVLDLTLRRGKADNAAPPPRPKRPQTPQAPLPYESIEVSVVNAPGDVSLGATLTMPKSAGPHPAVILVSGSGPQDRDETILDHRPFAVWADALTRRGVAVLRFDDRGVGKSTGNFADATTEDFVSDVLACLEFLGRDERIDASRIGVMGHSEGGLVAPLAARQRPENVAFLVLLAGPAVDGRTIVRSQNRLILAAEGAPEEQIQAHVNLVGKLLDLSAEVEDAKQYGQRMEETIAQFLEGFPEEQREARRPTPLAMSSLSQLGSPWFRFFLKFDPAPVLREVRCPTLAVYGEKDLQVDPRLNIPVLREAFQEREELLTVQELAGLNHLFQTCRTGSPTEYATIEETIAPAALEAVVEWVVGQTARD